MEATDYVWRRTGPAREIRHAVTQLKGTLQTSVPRGCRFGLVAQLLERVGGKLTRVAIGGIGEHELRCHLRDPAVLRARVVLARLLEHRFGSAHVLDALFRGLNRRQSVEVCRIAVIVAEVALVDRLDVVFEAAVEGMR